jgi:hypothetical protein
MRLSIIPSDGSVYKNDISYNNLVWEGTPINVHALQWFDVQGWIEFNNGEPNQDINELPQWALNAESAWQQAYDEAHADPLPPTALQNKSVASQKLYDTDWTTIPDIADPTKSNPYLTNVEEFVVYRNAIRQYAINPIAGNIDWIAKPEEKWST